MSKSQLPIVADIDI